MATLAQTQIGWQAYEAAGIISREQLEMLYCYDKQPIPTQVALFMQVRGVAGMKRMHLAISALMRH